jgi:hypothetical protein
MPGSPGADNMYKCNGNIIYISGEQIINDALSKVTLVVRVEQDEYDQDISFELLGKNMDLAEPLKVGDLVTVNFYIRGTKKDGIGGPYFFNSLRPTKISKLRKAKEEPEEEVEQPE